MKAPLYTQSGEKKGELELNSKIFETKINEDLMHQALVMQMANKRIVLAHTKEKGEVRGTGKKPYKQKGTGHARQGSLRNPQFIGGGITFGPRKNRNFSKDMPKKQRRRALFSALSAQAKNEKIIILENFDAGKDEKGNPIIKTKNVVEMMKKLKIERKALIVMPKKDIAFEKSSKNIPTIKTILVNYVNIYDLLNSHKIVFFKEALEKLDEIFLKEGKK